LALVAGPGAALLVVFVLPPLQVLPHGGQVGVLQHVLAQPAPGSVHGVVGQLLGVDLVHQAVGGPGQHGDLVLGGGVGGLVPVFPLLYREHRQEPVVQLVFVLLGGERGGQRQAGGLLLLAVGLLGLAAVGLGLLWGLDAGRPLALLDLVLQHAGDLAVDDVGAE